WAARFLPSWVPRGAETVSPPRAAGEDDVEDGDGDAEGDHEAAAAADAVAAGEHEDAGAGEEEEEGGVGVGDEGPGLLAAVQVQPVGDTQQEARFLPLLDDAAGQRVDVEDALVQPDVELVRSRPVDLARGPGKAELPQRRVRGGPVVRRERK